MVIALLCHIQYWILCSYVSVTREAKSVPCTRAPNTVATPLRSSGLEEALYRNIWSEWMKELKCSTTHLHSYSIHIAFTALGANWSQNPLKICFTLKVLHFLQPTHYYSSLSTLSSYSHRYCTWSEGVVTLESSNNDELSGLLILTQPPVRFFGIRFFGIRCPIHLILSILWCHSGLNLQYFLTFNLHTQSPCHSLCLDFLIYLILNWLLQDRLSTETNREAALMCRLEQERLSIKEYRISIKD